MECQLPDFQASEVQIKKIYILYSVVKTQIFSQICYTWNYAKSNPYKKNFVLIQNSVLKWLIGSENGFVKISSCSCIKITFSVPLITLFRMCITHYNKIQTSDHQTTVTDITAGYLHNPHQLDKTPTITQTRLLIKGESE